MESRIEVLDNIECISFITNGKGLKSSQVEVNFSEEKFGIQKDEKLKQKIEEEWDRKTSSALRIFNGTKFRLSDFHLRENCDVTGLTVKLDMGITDYKEHIGTNLAPYRSELLGTGGERGTRYARLSQAIGVGGWVITKDKKFFLVKNAQWKGEGQCLYDRPGGHAEPDEALLASGLPAGEYSQLSNNSVLRELFLSEQKEIQDEINIPIEKQGEVEMLGLVFNLDHAGRVGAEFVVPVDLSSEEVLTRYRSGEQPEADESTELVFVDLVDFQLGTAPEQHVAKNLTPHARGSLRLLKKIVGNLVE